MQPAAGHVGVLPTEVKAGEAQRFTVRVPSERDVDTVAVEVTFPDEVTVYSVKPEPGWDIRMLYRPDRRTKGVVFSGGRIGPGQFQEFDLLGTPSAEGTAVWRSRQTYADGVVKPWTGPPEEPGAAAPESGPSEPGPASAMTISLGGATPAAAATGGGGDDDASAAVWLGLIAIAVAAASAVGVGFLWTTRPAPLPDDE
ncbi:DUF1775 domain-containing protein [Miltoncostaea marina]|uniref:DUF1775 domain-containing protein n=1 Tax=Miltoncostaea marina TaxID=2843215 RepID=UPI001C3D65B4|nr:DUF1775 domain-containing protein [Miltoncostaea marina]